MGDAISTGCSEEFRRVDIQGPTYPAIRVLRPQSRDPRVQETMQILTSRRLQQQVCPEAAGSALHRRGRRTQQFDPVGIGIGQRPRGS